MKNTHVCSAEHAGFLDNGLRRLFQNPMKILSPYVQAGMNVADIGCGPGFFLPAMAECVGPSGKVHGYDIQDEMLSKAAAKFAGSPLQDRVKLHQCSVDGIGFTDNLDGVLAFYMVHEVPEKVNLLTEVREALVAGGFFLVIEPFLHVSKNSYGEFLVQAERCGFSMEEGPRIFFSRSSVLRKIL